MRNIIFTIFFTLLVSAAGGQNFIYSPSKSLVQNLNFNDITFDGIYFKNTSSSTLTLNWQLYDTTFIAGCSFEMCASGFCQLGLPVTGSFIPVAPGDSGWLKLHTTVGTLAGTNTVKYLVWVGQKNIDTLTFVINVADLTGAEQSLVNEEPFTIFPNPGNNIIHIQLPPGMQTPGTLTLRNALGELVFQKQITGMDDAFDSRELPVGLYFISIQSKERTLKSVLSIGY